MKASFFVYGLIFSSFFSIHTAQASKIQTNTQLAYGLSQQNGTYKQYPNYDAQATMDKWKGKVLNYEQQTTPRAVPHTQEFQVNEGRYRAYPESMVIPPYTPPNDQAPNNNNQIPNPPTQVTPPQNQVPPIQAPGTPQIPTGYAYPQYPSAFYAYPQQYQPMPNQGMPYQDPYMMNPYMQDPYMMNPMMQDPYMMGPMGDQYMNPCCW